MTELTKPSQATVQDDIVLDARYYRMFSIPASHSLQFLVIQRLCDRADEGEELYLTKENGCPTATTTVDEALVILNGFIKWDGCLDLDVAPRHYCGREDAGRLGKIINAIYDIAARRIPAWSPEDAA